MKNLEMKMNAESHAHLMRQVAVGIIGDTKLEFFFSQHNELIFDAIENLQTKRLNLVEQALNSQGESISDYQPKEQQQEWIEDMTKAAHHHFMANLPSKFEACFSELLAESALYAEAQLSLNLGEPVETQKTFWPTHQEYQRHVARFGVERYRTLPFRACH